jgi:hypothetical protein
MQVLRLWVFTLPPEKISPKNRPRFDPGTPATSWTAPAAWVAAEVVNAAAQADTVPACARASRGWMRSVVGATKTAMRATEIDRTESFFMRLISF